MARLPSFEIYCGRAKIVRAVGAQDWIAEIIDPPAGGSTQAEDPGTAIRLAIEKAVGCPVRIRELEIVGSSLTRHPVMLSSQEVRFEAEVLRDASSCPDCRGSGEYVGFTAREPCRTCDGRGCVPDSA